MALQHFLEETSKFTGIPVESLYCTQNGKRVCSDDDVASDGPELRWGVRLLGGKGGFGSMLRAIGAQIEKTTNREACRDLSGRRLRDIREERRLRDWAAQQPQREEEARQRKQEKLDRLLATPKFEFKDEAFDKAQQGLEEAIDAAVEQGSKAAAAASTSNSQTSKKRKPTKLWIDDDLSCSDSEEEESTPEVEIKRARVSV